MTAATVVFDTLAYANKLKAAGMDSNVAEVQAEAQAEILATLIDDKLITKEDMKNLEVATKQDIQSLRYDLVKLEHKVNVLRKDIIIKVGAMIFSSFGALAVLMTVLHFH